MVFAWDVIKQNFEFFLPLFINKIHGKLAFDLFRKLYGPLAQNGHTEVFLLDILLKATNTCVVQTMKGTKHNSEKGIIAFFHTYRVSNFTENY